MTDNLRFHLIHRFTSLAGALLEQKERRLLNRENDPTEKQKSILFLCPIVINTYNEVCAPYFEFFIRNIPAEKTGDRIELN